MIAGSQQQNPESVFRRSPPADRTTDTNIIAQSFPFGKPFLCKKHGKVRKPYPKIHKNHESRLPCKCKNAPHSTTLYEAFSRERCHKAVRRTLYGVAYIDTILCGLGKL